VPFNCPTWIMHQTNTDAQARAAGMLPKSTDAAEGRNFAENLNFVFMLGSVAENQTCGLVVNKQRRAARKPPKVLLIDGSFATVTDASATYVIRNKCIQPRDMADSIADGFDEMVEKGEKQPAYTMPTLVSDTLFSRAGTEI